MDKQLVNRMKLRGSTKLFLNVLSSLRNLVESLIIDYRCILGALGRISLVCHLNGGI